MALCSRRHGIRQQARQPAHPDRRRRSVTAINSLGSLFNGLKPAFQEPDVDAQFTGWLQDRGLPPQQLVLRDIAGQGRGLVARAAVRKGQALLQVPSTLTIDPDRALAESCLAPSIPSGACLADWTLLAVWLVEQRHAWRSGHPDAELWGEYMRVLPDTCGTVLDWAPGEAACLLAGSGLADKASDIQRAAEATWRELRPVVEEAQARGTVPEGVFTEGAVRWALGILLSRLIRLDSRGGAPVLVPWADYLNHAPQADCYIDWDEGSGSVVLRPDRDYAPGEQVFASYGPKSSGELLLSYGFVPPAGSNPHDAAHLVLGLDPADPLAEAKRAEMARYGVPTTESFPLRIDGLPAGLLSYVAFLDAQPQAAAAVAELAAVVLGEGRLPLWEGEPLEARALEGLAARCRRAAAGYPAASDADRVLADSVQQGGGWQQREALCAAIRMRERQILARTEFVVAGHAKRLRAAARR